MSDNKHSPGPWKLVSVAKTKSDLQQYAICCARDPIGTKANGIAAVWIRGGIEKTAANARLIAAAPELLYALQKIASCQSFVKGDVVDIARAAIAKATGKELL